VSPLPCPPNTTPESKSKLLAPLISKLFPNLYTLLPIQNNFPHENKEGLSLSPIFSADEGKKGKNNPETDAISWSKKSLKTNTG